MRIQFGAKPSAKNIAKYSRSPQWQTDHFENLETTTMDVGLKNVPGLLYKQFFASNNRQPAKKIQVIPFDKVAFEAPSATIKACWFGHSALLLRINSLNILIDPMLGPNAAPISPFPVKRFSDDTLAIIDDLPEIDLALISHDHYDHLDYDSILKLKPKVKQFYVALGVARHLVKWGIDESKIKEFDWWDQQLFNDITIHFTPTRHFSGRGLKDRAKSLWGGWVFKTTTDNIWFSGDGGYGKHFIDIGERLGPFDFAWMECGQYNELWHLIHFYPEESVQAAIDAKAQKLMPVHWAGFALAQHSWTEPAERFIAAAKAAKLDYMMPKPGQIFNLTNELKEPWWENYI
jgi:L-ascorbate metabolism protein UlaG (beta-lactamase superfamily)